MYTIYASNKKNAMAPYVSNANFMDFPLMAEVCGIKSICSAKGLP